MYSKWFVFKGELRRRFMLWLGMVLCYKLNAMLITEKEGYRLQLPVNNFIADCFDIYWYRLMHGETEGW